MRYFVILMAVILSSCGTIVKVNSVPVRQPSRTINKGESWVYLAGVVMGYSLGVHFDVGRILNK